jgi:chaperone required for assembly of F1-ATPase
MSTVAPSERDIIEVMSRYALAADAKDYALMRSLFFDDATVAMQFDSEFLDGQGVHFSDPDSFIQFVRETAVEYRASQHSLSNPLIEYVGETASLRLNLIATAFYTDRELPETTLYGFYEVSIKQSVKRWKIKTLKFTSIGSK